MDEQTITRAAEDAITDLELDCRVKAVSQNQQTWCIQFTDPYGEFRDKFRDQYGEENSARLIKEKIKRHIFQQQEKIRRQTKDGRGRSRSVKGAPRGAQRSRPEVDLLATLRETFGEVIDTASRQLADVIKGASDLTETASETAEDVLGVVDTAAREVVGSPGKRPKRRVKTKRASKAAKTSKSTRKVSPRGGKLPSKTSRKAGKKASGKAGKAAAKTTKKSRSKKKGGSQR